MAFRLTKSERTAIDTVAANLERLRCDLGTAVEAYNELCSKAFSDVEAAKVKYNECLAEVRDVRDEIVERLQDEFDDKSEKWQSGERGEQAQAFIDSLESLHLDEDDLPEPDEVKIEGFEHYDALRSDIAELE